MKEATKNTFATYRDYREAKQGEANNLPLFFAFSNDQLQRALDERKATVKDICRVGNNAFCLKSDLPIIKAYCEKKDPLPELMKNEKFAEDAFRYEMDNHEYAINWQGDWDVVNVFTPKEPEYSEEKDYRDYLREAGMEYAITAYERARRSHMKMARDNEWF